MNETDSDADPLAQLAEEFADRFRRGERPSLTEYAEKYPEHADRIRHLFPALVEMEQFGSIGGQADPLNGHGHAPTQLGEYRILAEVARGGMGIVYEAVQESLGRHVALKVFPSSRMISPTQLERFRREARAVARLHHTNIVPIFGVGEHQGVHFYAMQFIRGQSLDRVLNELGQIRRRLPQHVPAPDPVAADLGFSLAQGLMSGRFPDALATTQAVTNGAALASVSLGSGAARPEPVATSPVVFGDHSELGDQSSIAYARSVARVGVQVADALAYSHQQGILHRDIKPANLLLDLQGTVWVSDFGLVKEEGSDELTTQGDFVGTLRYMAPERFQGRSDPRGDVYGLGLTLYEMLTLRAAFADSDRARLVDRVQNEEPVRPRKIDPRIPRDLETIVLKAIAKEPSRRYASAAAMGDDLRRFLADRPIEARRVSPWERTWRWSRRNPGLAFSTATAAVLLVMLALGSAAWASRLGTELKKTGDARQAEREAKKAAQGQLWRSLLARAQAGRFSRRPGQRLDSLTAIQEAATIARKLGEPDEVLDQLRNEAIACLTLADMRPSTTSIPWPADVKSIIFDAKFQRYATTDPQGLIRVHQLGTSQPLLSFQGLEGVQTMAPFSPDGRYLASNAGKTVATAGADVVQFDVQVWSAGDGRPVFENPIPAHINNHFNEDSLFLPDGRGLVVIKPSGSLGVWDLATGKEVKSLETRDVPVGFSIHPDGRRVAVCYAAPGQSVEIWNLDTGRVEAELPMDPKAKARCVGWHPDGNQLGIGFEDVASDCQIWDTASNSKRPVIRLQGHNESVTRVAFHPGGELMLTYAVDNVTRLWEVRTGRLLVNLPAGLLDIHFSSDSRFCGYLYLAGGAYLVEVDPGREYRTLVANRPDRSVRFFEAAIGDDGLLAVGTDKGAGLWDLNSGRMLGQISEGRTDSVSLIPTPGGRELMTAGAAGLQRWPIHEDPAAPEVLQIGSPKLVPLPSYPTRAYVGQDGRIAVSSEYSGAAWVVDPTHWTVTTTLAPSPAINRATWSPDGRWIATSGWHTDRVRVWDSHTGAMVKELPVGVTNFAFFSPDGRSVVTSRGDGFRFWDLTTWKETRHLPLEVPYYPTWVEFSPDRTLMAIERSPAVIHLVEVASGRTVAKLEDPRGDRPCWLGFTPDSTKLVSISNFHQPIHVWDLRAIRSKLAAMDLDWKAPAYPSSAKPTHRRPLVVELPDPTPVSPENEARRRIGIYLRRLKDTPDNPETMNGLAWTYATAPVPLRDPTQAVQLAEQAVKLSPRNPMIRNTLGVAYYRAGNFREAITTLQQNLMVQAEDSLPCDLYFLAMSHQQLGQTELARSFMIWADRVTRSLTELTDEDARELETFHVEAQALIGK